MDVKSHLFFVETMETPFISHFLQAEWPLFSGRPKPPQILCRSCPSRSAKPPARTGTPCPWTPPSPKQKPCIKCFVDCVDVLFCLCWEWAGMKRTINNQQILIHTVYGNACIPAAEYYLFGFECLDDDDDDKNKVFLNSLLRQCWTLHGCIHVSPSLEFLHQIKGARKMRPHSRWTGILLKGW